MLHYRPYQVIPGQEGIARIYPELRWPLIQRYVPQPEIECTASADQRCRPRNLAATVSFKREQWPPDVGVSTVQIGCVNEPVRRAGLQVVDRMLSRGIFEIEVLVDGENLYAIDLNPRAFGFVALDMARGIDLPWLWFRSTMERLSPAPMQTSEIPVEARHKLLHFLRHIVNSADTGDPSSG